MQWQVGKTQIKVATDSVSAEDCHQLSRKRPQEVIRWEAVYAGVQKDQLPSFEAFCANINPICADHNLLTYLTSQVPYLLVLLPSSSTPHTEILEEHSIPAVPKPDLVSLWPYPACCADRRWPGISKLAFFFQQFSQNSAFFFFTLRLSTAFCFFSPRETQLCLTSDSRADLVQSEGYSSTSRHNIEPQDSHVCAASPQDTRRW